MDIAYTWTNIHTGKTQIHIKLKSNFFFLLKKYIVAGLQPWDLDGAMRSIGIGCHSGLHSEFKVILC